MDFYYESSRICQQAKNHEGTIKNIMFKSTFRNKPKLYAIVFEALKYDAVLSSIVNDSGIMKEECMQTNEALAKVLIYDLLIGKGVKGGGRVKRCLLQYKVSLQDLLKKEMDKAGVDRIVDMLPDNISRNKSESLPRYVRVNLLKTTVEAVIQTFTSEGYTQVANQNRSYDKFITDVKNLGKKEFIRDLHLPDLLIFQPSTNFHNYHLTVSGEIILQDKASCFPAFILNPPEGSLVIDSCAAPGNKTSHIASVMRNKGIVFAFDLNESRVNLMNSLIAKAGVKCTIVRCLDFLTVDAFDPEFADVEYILLDPSCSGSGIVSRLDEVTDDSSSKSQSRLQNLSRFQVMLLKHALRFPNVKRVVYSTCSVNSEENEDVIEDALMQFQSRFRLKKIMPDWPHRGMDGFKHSQFFVRMWPEKDLTNGFFIACLERIGCDKRSTAKSSSGTPSVVENNVEDLLKTGPEFSSEDTSQIQDVNTSKRKKSKKRKRDRSASEVNNLDKVEINGEKDVKEEVDGDLMKSQKKKLKKNKKKAKIIPSNDIMSIDDDEYRPMNNRGEQIIDECKESDVIQVSKKKSKKKSSSSNFGIKDVVNEAGCDESVTYNTQLNSNVGNDGETYQQRKKQSKKTKKSRIGHQTKSSQHVDLDKSCQIIEMEPKPVEITLLDTPYAKKSKKSKKKNILDEET